MAKCQRSAVSPSLALESPQPVQGWPALAGIPIVTGTSLLYKSALCGLERFPPHPTCVAAALASLPPGPLSLQTPALLGKH